MAIHWQCSEMEVRPLPPPRGQTKKVWLAFSVSLVFAGSIPVFFKSSLAGPQMCWHLFFGGKGPAIFGERESSLPS